MPRAPERVERELVRGERGNSSGGVRERSEQFPAWEMPLSALVDAVVLGPPGQGVAADPGLELTPTDQQRRRVGAPPGHRLARRKRRAADVP